MMDPTADRLAQTSLSNHAHQGTFTVPVGDDEEGQALAKAFQVLGCTVEPEPFSFGLRVTAPRQAA